MYRGRNKNQYPRHSEESDYPYGHARLPLMTVAEWAGRQPCLVPVKSASASKRIDVSRTEDSADLASRSLKDASLRAAGQSASDAFDIDNLDDSTITDDAAAQASVDAVRATGFEPGPATPVEPDPRTHLRIFVPALAAMKLVEVGVYHAKPLFISSSDRGNASGLQERWWRRMHEVVALRWRPRLMARPEHVAALDDLRPTMPNFAALLEFVGDALSAALNTGKLRLQRLQRQKVVALDQPVVEDIASFAHNRLAPRCGVVGQGLILHKNARLQLRALLLADPGQFKFGLPAHKSAAFIVSSVVSSKIDAVCINNRFFSSFGIIHIFFIRRR
jgi:hypothetical protein